MAQLAPVIADVRVRLKGMGVWALKLGKRAKPTKAGIHTAIQLAGAAVALTGLALLVSAPVAMIAGGVLLVVAIERQ